eukprot:TRINITY_DN1567_c0_g1_i3.p1 TRINITY_DN1567_c0_g1~~TRINITY_DN1567_c0_g1_i3.p1  ORF type:complete len:417 (+),score=104.53 TRINITY_DN1567_c0_g1_i3:304-1554(+)
MAEDATITTTSSLDDEEIVSLSTSLESAVKIKNHRRKTQPLELTRIRSRWLENQRKKQENQKVNNPTGWRIVQTQNVGVNEIRHMKPKPAGSLRLVFISDTHSGHTGYFKTKDRTRYKLSRRQTKAKIIREKKNNSTAEEKAEEESKEETTEADSEDASKSHSWLPDGDILIHTGDFTVSGQAGEVKDFIQFLDTVPHKHKVVIAGNHDICLEPEWYCTNQNWQSFHPEMTDQESELQKLKEELKQRCTYLEDDLLELKVEPNTPNEKKLYIYGSPWQPVFHYWAFNLIDSREEAERTGVADELTMEDVAEAIPEGIDILLTHGPSFGSGKVELGSNGLLLGSKPLGKAVERILPTIHAFGHIHEAYGVGNKTFQVVVDAEKGYTKKRSVTFVNSSAMNKRSRLVNNPIVIDIAPK